MSCCVLPPSELESAPTYPRCQLWSSRVLNLRPVQIAILYIVFSIFAGGTFVWCSFWEYMFIDLGDV